MRKMRAQRFIAQRYGRWCNEGADVGAAFAPLISAVLLKRKGSPKAAFSLLNIVMFLIDVPALCGTLADRKELQRHRYPWGYWKHRS